MDKPLTAKEISVIIDKCGKNGVKSFKFAGLELDFSPKSEAFTEIPQKVEQKVETLEEFSQKPSPQEAFATLLEESKYLDPVLYEKLSGLDEQTQNSQIV